jgi:hypothetical protein
LNGVERRLILAVRQYRGNSSLLEAAASGGGSGGGEKEAPPLAPRPVLIACEAALAALHTIADGPRPARAGPEAAGSRDTASARSQGGEQARVDGADWRELAKWLASVRLRQLWSEQHSTRLDPRRTPRTQQTS